MRKNYLISAFEQTLEERFPAQAEVLRAALEARLERLRTENAGASPEKLRHLESQILPGIAAYETLQIVISRAKRLQAKESDRADVAASGRENMLRCLRA